MLSESRVSIKACSILFYTCDIPQLNLANVSLVNDIGYCKCDSGYYGASCMHECPGGSSSPCTGHGVCSTTNGHCVCQSRWTNTLYNYTLYTQGQ